MKAVPINSQGEVIGAAKTFSDLQWQRMKSAIKNPKLFPWKMVDDSYEPSVGVQLMKVSTKDAVSVKQPEIFTEEKPVTKENEVRKNRNRKNKE